MKDPSLSQLRGLAEGTALAAALDYALAQSHEARLDAIQRAVDFACNQLELHKHKKQGMSEDAITLQVCEMLNAGGFGAAHDSDIGGHCDIVIKGRDSFLWLAEAKEHDSYEWLDKGFKQLSTRYSTGVRGQDQGEILIYCYSRDAKTMLKRWREQLEARNGEVSTQDATCGNPLVFSSTHKHSASGLDFHIRHKAVALFWDPEDRRGVKHALLSGEDASG